MPVWIGIQIRSYSFSLTFLQLFDKFVLEFHLPFLALRSTALSSTKPAVIGSRPTTGTHIDASFLDLNCTQHRSRGCPCRHTIQESQISVVICGWDNHNWVGWGLFDTYSDPTDEFAPEDERVVEEDYFTTDGEDGPVIDANDPIWDPRKYWLRIIDIRVRSVLKEWLWLVRNIEAGVVAWVSATVASDCRLLMSSRKTNIPCQVHIRQRQAPMIT
jgi:hypothetical protein